jgi:hypothetical protein
MSAARVVDDFSRQARSSSRMLKAFAEQKEFADRYEELQLPIKFKTKKQFRWSSW